MQDKRNRLLAILSFVLVMCTTLAYSALATNLAITGEATFRAVADMRVTDIQFDSVENGATLSYDATYTKDTITAGFILPNANSSISYNVTITNKGTIDQAIYDLQIQSCNNNDMIILVDDIPINEALPMIVPFGTSKTIKITYKTTSPSNNVINIINKFIFKEVYYVEYNTKGGSNVATQVKYKDIDLILEGKPTKSKYVFTGWSESENSSTISYVEGATYTLNQNKTLYAVYRQGESTFLAGTEFNAKIRQLAGNTNATYETTDSNITSIVRANSVPSSWIVNGTITPPISTNIVSTPESDFPIYAWYSNGVINWYTDVDNPYMNTNSSNMFRGLTNTSSIAINTIDTSRSTNMNLLFYNCNSLSSINLSNFSTVLVSSMDSMFEGCSSLTSLTLSSLNTSNVLSMESMFKGCSSLSTITFGNSFNIGSVGNMNSMFKECSSISTLNLSGFATSNVTNMGSMFEGCTSLSNLTISSFVTTSLTNGDQMFKNCSSLTSLDISNFNLSNVTSITDILSGMTALRQLKTPRAYPSNLSITLPNKYYSANNTEYQTLTTGSPTQSWIKLPYTVVFNNNTGTGTMNDQKIGVDATTTLTTNTFTKEGYTFVGWNTKANGTGTAYLNNASVTNLKTYNETITLYAQWTANTYTIVFNKNDNSATGTMSNQTVAYDETVQLNSNNYEKTGYKFIGWNTESNGSGTTYTDGQSVSNIATSGTKILYAQWQRVMAENIEHENNDLNCEDAQCVIDELYYMLY